MHRSIKYFLMTVFAENNEKRSDALFGFILERLYHYFWVLIISVVMYRGIVILLV